jgi:hypothetical protein
MTYALREACSLASDALAALMARGIALTASAALGLSGDPVHEPVHAGGRFLGVLLTMRYARSSSAGL